MALEARLIDPRDTGWEVDDPVFRVLLWKRQQPATADLEEDPTRGPASAWHSEEWDLTGGDVNQALDWLRARADDWDAHQLLAVVPASAAGNKGLLRLAGTDPRG